MTKQFVKKIGAVSRRKLPSHNTENLPRDKQCRAARDPLGDQGQIVRGHLVDHPADDLGNDVLDGSIAVEPAWMRLEHSAPR